MDPVTVELPSGAPFQVLGPDEADWIDRVSAAYQEEFKFSNISDVQDLDRIIAMELQVYRWGLWISLGERYDGSPIINSTDLQKQIKEFSGEIRQNKKTLGMDAVSRDKARGEGSVPHYLENLREKAKLFGIHREHQLDRALELANQLITIVTVYRNAINDEERRLIHHTRDDIINWITEVFVPEYQAIDEYFRTHIQRYWVQDQEL